MQALSLLQRLRHKGLHYSLLIAHLPGKPKGEARAMPEAAHPPSSGAKEGTQSQVVAFPRSPVAERPSHNLPLQLSSFVGRERQIAEVKRLLGDNRLLTLTGAGGCGKTRLALAVASTLGVREAQDRPLTETLSNHLGSTKMLLALDNCEHLVEGCSALADALLRA